MLYMVTVHLLSIYPQCLYIYIPYMDPMGYGLPPYTVKTLVWYCIDHPLMFQ